MILILTDVYAFLSFLRKNKYIMIRLLILLITLNALSPMTGLSCSGASISSKVITFDVQHLTKKQTSSDMLSQAHCNNPSMMDSKRACHSSCCVNCLAVPAMTTTIHCDLFHTFSPIKPIAHLAFFYTRYFPPESPPPLV